MNTLQSLPLFFKRLSRINSAIKPLLTLLLLSCFFTAPSNASFNIELKKGQQLDIILPVLKEGADQKMNNYIGNVFPLAKKYGFKEHGFFLNAEVLSGDHKPQAVALYSWPNSQAESQFEQEKLWPNYKSTRVDIWDSLKIVKGIIKEDTRVVFDKNKTYVLFVGWLKKAEQYSQYVATLQNNLTSLQGRISINVEVTELESLLLNETKPSFMMIIEWDKLNDPQNNFLKQTSDNKLLESLQSFRLMQY